MKSCQDAGPTAQQRQEGNGYVVGSQFFGGKEKRRKENKNHNQFHNAHRPVFVGAFLLEKNKMFDYSELAKELNASMEEKEDKCFKTAPKWRKFGVEVNGVSFNFLAKDDSHYNVKEGTICFLVCSHTIDKYGQSHYMEDAPSINVSAKKSVVQVAADIRRRLLNSETIEQIRKFHKSICRAEEQTDAKIQMMQRASQLIQSPESIGPNTEKIWTSSNFPVQFAVSNWFDDRVMVSQMTLTIDQLEKICKALLQ